MDADGEIRFTRVGWAVKSPEPPRRKDMYWLAPSGNVYYWDGDNGWMQIDPPPLFPAKEIQHG